MKQYIPGLIPEKYRVLPDYFRLSDPPAAQSAPAIINTVWWVLTGVGAIISLLVWSIHWGFGFSLLLIAFFTAPKVRQAAEKAFRFRFTTVLKTAILCALTLYAAVMGQQYQATLVTQKEAVRLRIVAKQKADREQQRQQMRRIASVRTLLAQADKFVQKRTYDKAIRLYKESLRLTTEVNTTEQHQAWTGLANGYFQSQQYQLALQAYDHIVTTSAEEAEFRYKRALCYRKLGQKTEALTQLYQASNQGYAPASKLYNQLNPERKRVLYYQTVCCDGSYSPSNAKGRGACSHHGGVCNWDKPIYQTYRQYDINGL